MVSAIIKTGTYYLLPRSTFWPFFTGKIALSLRHRYIIIIMYSETTPFQVCEQLQYLATETQKLL